jgi:hypothetical protein
MSQGITIKGKTTSDVNVPVKVDNDGVVYVYMTNPGGGGGGDPLAGYGLNHKRSDATYQYYGYEDGTGAWYVRRVGIASGDITYVKGASSYPTPTADASVFAALTPYASYGTTF